MTKTIRDAIVTAAQRHGLDPLLIEALVIQESAARPSAYRFEPAYWERYCKDNPQFAHEDPCRIAASYGLMQVMYPTALAEGFTGEPEELFKIATNLDVGCRHLARLLERYADDTTKALAAYNGGPGGITRPLPLAYARSVLARYQRFIMSRP